MLFCAVFIHFSVSFFGIRIPPSNRRRDAAHNLVAYFARAKPKLKEREKFDPEVPLKFLLDPLGNLPHCILTIVLKLCSELSGKLSSICAESQLELLRSAKGDFKLNTDQCNAAPVCEN